MSPHTHLESDITPDGILARPADAETWSALQMFTAGAGVSQLYVGSGYVPQLKRLRVLDGAAANNWTGHSVEVGGVLTIPANSIAGISGQAYKKDAASTASYGLYFLAGTYTHSIALTAACRTGILGYGVGTNIATAQLYEASDPLLIFTSLTTLYGYACATLTKGTARRPFYDPNAPSSGHFNLLRSTLQLFSSTPQFGSGVGVLGIGNALTNPSTNPTGGGVLYATGGALRWRGSSGTDTLIAAA